MGGAGHRVGFCGAGSVGVHGVLGHSPWLRDNAVMPFFFFLCSYIRHPGSCFWSRSASLSESGWWWTPILLWPHSRLPSGKLGRRLSTPLRISPPSFYFISVISMIDLPG